MLTRDLGLPLTVLRLDLPAQHFGPAVPYSTPSGGSRNPDEYVLLTHATASLSGVVARDVARMSAWLKMGPSEIGTRMLSAVERAGGYPLDTFIPPWDLPLLYGKRCE